MKRLITLLLVFVLTATSAAGVSASTTGLYSGININLSLTERAETDYVRRDEFASVISALMGFAKSGTADTPFADVKEDNIYASAICTVKDSNMMNGVNEYEFSPSSTITIRDAAVVFVRLLGYSIWADSKGGYPVGYSAVATSLKMFNKVSKPLDSMLTFGDLWLMCDWALETPVAESSFTMSGGELTEEIRISKNSLTLLEKNLGYTRYKAYAEEIIGDTYSVKVTITESDDRGIAKYTAGKALTLKASPDINIFAFDKAPVYIWINDADELMHITTVENCEIIYRGVYSVNRDYNPSSAYIPSQITEMAFWDIDKDFKMADDVRFYKNGVREYNKIHLTDRFARAVITDGKISSVETWDFKEGGIVKETNFKSIIYTRGDASVAIGGLGEYEREILILNGEMRDIKELKPDTLIDYYVSPDKETLIILASERKHTDIFEGYSTEDVQIGSAVLKTAQTVYTCTDEKSIYSEGNLAELSGSEVSAYVDPLGRVRYIRATKSMSKNTFVGYLAGLYGYDEGEAQGLDKTQKMLVVNLVQDGFPKAEYIVHKKVQYDIGETGTASEIRTQSENQLKANADSKNEKAIYRFRINANNEITKISSLGSYFGYDANSDGFVRTNSGYFPGNGDPTYVEIGSKRLYFPRDEKIITLSQKNDGEVVFGTTTYGALEGKSLSGDNPGIVFFGEYMSSEFDLILLCADMIGMKGTKKYGVVSKLLTGIDENGEETRLAEIGGIRYTFDPSYAVPAGENILVSYYEIIGDNAQYDITIEDSVALDGDFNSWTALSTANITFHRGTVEKIDSKRLFVRDDSNDEVIDAFFFHDTGCKYYIYDESTATISEGSSQDSIIGEKVIFILTGNETVSIIFYLN